MFEPGTQVGRYEIQRRLGRGGMGTVYVAHDPVLGRMVAIKVFAGDLDVPDARERFSREARAAAALNHPSIVTVYDFGEYEAQPFIVMEYVPGETLASVIRRKTPVSTADKIRWMEELCAGAGYAHRMSVVHRDIKPANLMIDRGGRLKILDFGIARMLGIASNTAVMIGTPGYMAPEQITGDTVDHRSDQFSIGVVFYELLAYREAFPGETLPTITHRILSEEPMPLDQLVPEVSPDVIGIVRQALKKNIAERFKDTEAMRAAIARVHRQFESDRHWNTPTLPVGKDITPPAGGSRGTGSSRRRSGDAVGVAQLTPPPDPRRTDREALARRRTTQLETALLLARTLFERRELDAALDACQQALTFDETHVGALELELEIETALSIREGEIAADSAMTTASEPASGPKVASARLFESQTVTRFDDKAFSLSGLPTGSFEPSALPSAAPPVPPAPAVDETAIRLPVALGDATIVAPSRRTPSPLPAQKARPATIPPVAKVPATVTGPAAAKGAVPAVAKGQSAAPIKRPGGLNIAALLNTIAQTLQGVGPAVRPVVDVVRGAAPSTRALIIWAGVGAVALAAVVVVGIVTATRGPVPTGTVVIDAVPWANVTSIQRDDGTPQPLPSPASTPLSLALPVGSYQITLTGPPPESKAERVSVRIDLGGTSIVPLPRFESITVEDYFEQYLVRGDAPPAAPSDPTSVEASLPTAVPAPTGVGR